MAWSHESLLQNAQQIFLPWPRSPSAHHGFVRVVHGIGVFALCLSLASEDGTLVSTASNQTWLGNPIKWWWIKWLNPKYKIPPLKSHHLLSHKTMNASTYKRFFIAMFEYRYPRHLANPPCCSHPNNEELGGLRCQVVPTFTQSSGLFLIVNQLIY